MTFSVVGVGSASLSERLRIHPDGNASLGANETIARLSIRGATTSSSGSALIVRSASTNTLFQVRDDGKCVIGNGGVDGTIMLNIRGTTATSSGSTLRLWNANSVTTFQVRDDGAYTFFGGTLGVADSGWTQFTNLTTLKTGDANTLTLSQLCDIVGTLINALRTKGIISA